MLQREKKRLFKNRYSSYDKEGQKDSLKTDKVPVTKRDKEPRDREGQRDSLKVDR